MVESSLEDGDRWAEVEERWKEVVNEQYKYLNINHVVALDQIGILNRIHTLN